MADAALPAAREVFGIPLPPAVRSEPLAPLTPAPADPAPAAAAAPPAPAH